MLSAEYGQKLGDAGWRDNLRFREKVLEDPTKPNRAFHLRQFDTERKTLDGPIMACRVTALELDNMFHGSRNTVLSAEERRFVDGTVEYLVATEAPDRHDYYGERKTYHVYYWQTYGNDQATRRIPGSYSVSPLHSPEEFFDGMKPLDELPKQIDVISTVRALINQAERGDFQNPVLVEPAIAAK